MTDSNQDYVYDEESGEWLPASELAQRQHPAVQPEVRDAVGNLLADAQRHNSKSPNIRYKQADLSVPFRIDRKVDVLLCVNLLIQPSVDTREKILENGRGLVRWELN